MMGKLRLFFVSVFVVLLYSCGENNKTKEEHGSAPLPLQDYSFIDKSLDKAVELYRVALKENSAENGSMRSENNNGTIMLAKPGHWTSGFFPGSLWYLYNHTKDPIWLHHARTWTEVLEPLKNKKTSHDICFTIYNSYGTGYQLTKDTSYARIINEASETLIKRYNPNVGCIEAWDEQHWNKQWAYPVIIDNMMNFQLLMFSFQHTGDSTFLEIANSHAQKTIKNHFKDDYSSYHIVDYDSLTGEVIGRGTNKGLDSSSAWARGQAWGLYGFTSLYGNTQNELYLQQAEKIAKYIMSYPTMPDDKIPYWDFNHDVDGAPRDASAAAIIASALVDLSSHTKGIQSRKYLNYATEILKTLSSREYLNVLGTGHNFILLHSTGSYRLGIEIDKPTIVADFYYLEGLTKLKNIVNQR